MDSDFTQPCHGQLKAYDEALLRLRSLPIEVPMEDMHDPAPIWVTVRVVAQV